MEYDSNETVLDVINDKLQSLNAKSFVLRIAYMGDNKFDNKKWFSAKFKSIIDDINSNYCDVRTHGVLYINKNHFFVMCEGSENTIVQQINAMFKEFELDENRAKLLFVYHNVRERRFFNWITVYGESKVDDSENYDKPNMYLKYLQKCIDKLKYLYDISFQNSKKKIEELELDGLDLPDFNLTNYVLDCPYTMKLKDYASMYLNLPEYSYCFENSWPAPYDFTPYLEESELQKTYIELMTNIDDFLTEELEVDDGDKCKDLLESDKNNDDDDEFNSEMCNLIERRYTEQYVKSNQFLRSQQSLDESKLINEIKKFKTNLKMSYTNLEANTLQKTYIDEKAEELLESDENDDEFDPEFKNLAKRRLTEQYVNDNKVLRARQSLDESKLINEMKKFGIKPKADTKLKVKAAQKTNIEELLEGDENDDAEFLSKLNNLAMRRYTEQYVKDNNFLRAKPSLDEAELIKEIKKFGIKHNIKEESSSSSHSSKSFEK